MCGIFGYNQINRELPTLFFDSMKSRGPDAKEFKEVGGWTLGHLRLSIIDTSSGANQPFSKGGSTITFNGEIYNYVELKENYLKGVELITTSDTEILLELLNRYGLKILNKLNGMFAFAWHDGKTSELVLVRDRFGVKPLNWCKHNGVFYFASELKPLISLRKENKFNPLAIKAFMEDTATDFNSQTFVDGIFQIEPGHYMKFSNNAQIIEKWYRGTDFEFDQSIFLDYQKTIDAFEEILSDSIKIRCRSDVPVCITLSGGLDSAIIYTLMKERTTAKVTPFTFTHPGSSTDESKKVAKLVAEYSDEAITVQDDPGSSVKDYREALTAMEFPIWSFSAMGYLNMYKAIHKKNFKVVLEGHGSDEQLGGYPVFVKTAAREALVRFKLPLAFDLYRVAAETSNSNLDQGENRSRIRTVLSEIKAVTKYEIGNITSSSRVNYLNLQSVLEDSFNYKIMPMVLRAFDRLSMSQSLESRLPFMDFRVVEFLKKTPLELKANGIGSKAILREILKKYKKNYIYEDKVKTGYASDLKRIFKNDEFKRDVETQIKNFGIDGFDDNKQVALAAIQKNDILWTDIENITKVASIRMVQDIFEVK